MEQAEWFEAMPPEPIGRPRRTVITKVEIVDRCCLDSLRKMEGNPCLIVMANEGLPLKQNNGSALAVFQGSSLCDIIEAAAGAESLSLPRHGGYYARSVLVHQLSDSTTVSFESSMVLMTTLWSTPETVVAELREDSKVRLLNVLQKCGAQGHTELVFGAWGLLDHVTLEEISRTSALLQECFHESSSLTKVTFAVRPDEEKLHALSEILQ